METRDVELSFELSFRNAGPPKPRWAADLAVPARAVALDQEDDEGHDGGEAGANRRPPTAAQLQQASTSLLAYLLTSPLRLARIDTTRPSVRSSYTVKNECF